MSRIIKSSLFITLLIVAGVFTCYAKGLPIVEIIGNRYYVYEVKKGDSVFGIAKSQDWDLDELQRLNPNTIKNLKKGDKLYYPLEKGKEVKSDSLPEVVAEEYIEPITHIVKKGETVYSISMLYGIPIEQIYAAHPSARAGIKAGEEIELPQPGKKQGNEEYYVYYNIKKGDTLYAVAQQFNTTVNTLMRANPGVSEKNFRAGSKIRIPQGKDSRKREMKQVEEINLSSIDSYKVSKDDTWDTISQKTGIDKEDLLESNGNWHKLKKDEVILVPRVDTLVYEKEVIWEDPREQTSEGLNDIYTEANNIETIESQQKKVNIAYVMMEPSSNRDVDFTLGFLTGIDNFRNKGYKINFKVLDGTKSSLNVIDSLSGFDTDIIFSTSEKGIPSYLAEYAEVSRTPLVNVFDARNQTYTSNPYIVQYLTPSAIFNAKISDYVINKYNGTTVVYVGNDDAEEESTFLNDIRNGMPDSPVLTLTLDEFNDYPLIDGNSYLIYGNVSKKANISRLLETVEKAKAESPLADVTVMGRPNWVVYEENLLSKYTACDVIIPARFYVNTESNEAQKFINHFKALFERGPIKSYPLYAGTGYDLATYFIPMLVSTGRDMSEAGYSNGTVVSDISFDRLSAWSGYYNPVSYIVRYVPYLPVQIIKL